MKNAAVKFGLGSKTVWLLHFVRKTSRLARDSIESFPQRVCLIAKNAIGSSSAFLWYSKKSKNQSNSYHN